MKFFAIATIATVSANQFESMNEDQLLVNLESTLSSALSSEARGDGDAAVAKRDLQRERLGQHGRRERVLLFVLLVLVSAGLVVTYVVTVEYQFKVTHHARCGDPTPAMNANKIRVVPSGH